MSGRAKSSRAEEAWPPVSAACAGGGSSAAGLKKGFQAAGWPGAVPLQARVQPRSCAARLAAARSMSHRARATLEAQLHSI